MKKFCFVIPCRNEEKFIGKCLTAILSEEYPKEYLEVLVVDGMSEDGTREIVRNIISDFPIVKLLDNPHRVTPQALNIGIKNTNADIIVIFGAHAHIINGFIYNCLDDFGKDENIACVGGVIENIYENKVSEAVGLAMSSPFGVGNAHFRTGKSGGYVDTVAFGAYKREVLIEVGLFDEDLVRNQDDELNFRLIKSGYKIYLDKAIWSKYFVRSSFTKLIRQFYQYGYWKVYVNMKHKTITTLRQLVPALFVLFLLFGFVLSLFNNFLQILYFSGLGIYFGGAIVSALFMTKKLKTMLLVIISFLILHFSYGFGYIHGIWHFFLFGKLPSEKSMTLTR